MNDFAFDHLAYYHRSFLPSFPLRAFLRDHFLRRFFRHGGEFARQRVEP